MMFMNGGLLGSRKDLVGELYTWEGYIMSNKIIVSVLAAAALASGSAAFAQDRDYHNDRDNGWQQQQQQQRADERWQGDRENARDERWRAQRDYEREQRWQARHHREREDRMQGGWGRTEGFSAGYDGAGPHHNLRRGERLPSRYRTNQYVVDNWRAHRLHRPPHGYHWVQTGADYVLVGMRSGVIAQIMLSQ
jgi:Ni/Co efflux regulator RcnB